jgi:hypothetical protein
MSSAEDIALGRQVYMFNPPDRDGRMAAGETPKTALLSALARNDVPAVVKLLSQGAVPPDYKMTLEDVPRAYLAFNLLHMCACCVEGDCVEMFKGLQACGVPYEGDVDGTYPFEMAVVRHAVQTRRLHGVVRGRDGLISHIWSQQDRSDFMMGGNSCMACAYAAFTGRVRWFKEFWEDAGDAARETAEMLNSTGVELLEVIKDGATAAGIDASTNAALSSLYLKLASDTDGDGENDGLDDLRQAVLEIETMDGNDITLLAALTNSDWDGIAECAKLIRG